MKGLKSRTSGKHRQTTVPVTTSELVVIVEALTACEAAELDSALFCLACKMQARQCLTCQQRIARADGYSDLASSLVARRDGSS